MNPKENARRILRFDNPERIVTSPPSHFVGFLGCNHEGYNGGGHSLPVGSKWTDIWGVEWHREHEGVMGFPRGNPLSDLPNALKHYRWPDPDDKRLTGRIYEATGTWQRDNTFLCGSHRDTLWEKSYMLVGMENMMCFFYTEPNAVRELLHRIMDFHLGIARHYVKACVEMVALSDDLGTQQGPLISPEMVKAFFVPEYRRLFDFDKQHQVLISFHSCGHIEPMLGIFMDLGVDILNPVQATANNLSRVRQITAGKMALSGSVSSSAMMEGPSEKIAAEARLRMWQLGRQGGYFCGPDQAMPWPPEHMDALKRAIEEYGEYPLERPTSAG